MKYFIMAKFFKHLNLRICKYWYILCYEKQKETHYKWANWEPTKIPKPIKLAFI